MSEKSNTQRFCASAHAQFWHKHGDGELRKVLNSGYISTKSRRLVDISALILFSSARYDISRYIRWQRRAFLKTRFDNFGVYFAWCSALSVLLAIIHVVICEVSVEAGQITRRCVVFRRYWSYCWWCVWSGVCVVIALYQLSIKRL